jgi:hypothetical protein
MSKEAFTKDEVTYYTRPKGIMGGPCLHCQGSQPEHVGLTCQQVRENRRKGIRKLMEKAVPDETLSHTKPEVPASKVVVYPTPWRLESRNVGIADTGDYDGVIEIKSADGKTVTECWNPSDDDEAAFQRIVDVMNAHDAPGVHCVHCNGKGVETQHYDEETGWSDPDVPCATCCGSGRIRTVEQYLKTVPANWHEDSSVRTWFPLLDEEVARLRRAEASCNEHHAEIRQDETTAEPDMIRRPRDPKELLAHFDNPAAFRQFEEYVVKNYPPNTVIARPDWHAPKLWRQALYAIAMNPRSAVETECDREDPKARIGSPEHTQAEAIRTLKASGEQLYRLRPLCTCRPLPEPPSDNCPIHGIDAADEHGSPIVDDL